MGSGKMGENLGVAYRATKVRQTLRFTCGLPRRLRLLCGTGRGRARLSPAIARTSAARHDASLDRGSSFPGGKPSAPLRPSSAAPTARLWARHRSHWDTRGGGAGPPFNSLRGTRAGHCRRVENARVSLWLSYQNLPGRFYKPLQCSDWIGLGVGPGI